MVAFTSTRMVLRIVTEHNSLYVECDAEANSAKTHTRSVGHGYNDRGPYGALKTNGAE